MNNNMNNVFTAESISYYHNIPVLKIVDKDNDRSLYLSVFRSYSFQFSGSEDGDGNYGSTAVVTNLKTMFDIMNNDASYAYIYQAVTSILYTKSWKIADRIPNCWYGRGSDIWNDWIKQTIEYIRNYGRDY